MAQTFFPDFAINTAMVTVTNATTITTAAALTCPGGSLTGGACYGFRFEVHASRGATATAVNLTAEFRVAGTARFGLPQSLSTTNGFNGRYLFSGTFKVLGVGSAAPYVVLGNGWNQVSSGTPAILQTVPAVNLTLNTANDTVLDLRAFFSAAVAATTYRTLDASIWRIT